MLNGPKWIPPSYLLIVDGLSDILDLLNVVQDGSTYHLDK